MQPDHAISLVSVHQASLVTLVPVARDRLEMPTTLVVSLKEAALMATKIVLKRACVSTKSAKTSALILAVPTLSAPSKTGRLNASV